MSFLTPEEEALFGLVPTGEPADIPAPVAATDGPDWVDAQCSAGHPVGKRPPGTKTGPEACEKCAAVGITASGYADVEPAPAPAKRKRRTKAEMEAARAAEAEPLVAGGGTAVIVASDEVVQAAKEFVSAEPVYIPGVANLRDQFAMAALPALNPALSPDDAARIAYSIADAMVRARG